MKCPCCNTAMGRRDGKFGEFFYCKTHGTISYQHGNVVATGEIKKRLRKQYMVLKLSNIGNSYIDRPSMLLDMERQMMGFGVRLAEIDRFIEGDSLELMQLNAQDDPDHWLNTRPY